MLFQCQKEDPVVVNERKKVTVKERKQLPEEGKDMHFNVKEDIIQITSLWQGERFEDGRPRVRTNI